MKNLIETALQLPPEVNIKIERAHRSLGLKPARAAPPRSIIVRFLDYTVKKAVLQQAWAQRQVKFQGEVIYFDQDYSPEVQRKRARVRGVIKQLKEKGIQAKCRFPAQLRVVLESGVKTFPTLVEAAPTLMELGIAVQVSERERLEQELSRETAGLLEVTCAYFIFSVLCVKSSYILDKLVNYTQVIFVNTTVRSIALRKGKSGESKMITRNV